MHMRDAGGHTDHHRDVTGGEARAAVFGISDGLVSNIALILGFAGANADPANVRLAGIAGLTAGAISMAAGEWVSMKAQAELFEREAALERAELKRVPAEEQAELAAMWKARGIEDALADQFAAAIHADDELALRVHLQEELGVSSDDFGNPMGAAIASFFAFAVGAFMPLVPWFFAQGMAAVFLSIGLGLFTAVAVGLGLAVSTEQPWLKPVVRQVAIGTLAAAVTYGIGSVVGVNV